MASIALGWYPVWGPPLSLERRAAAPTVLTLPAQTSERWWSPLRERALETFAVRFGAAGGEGSVGEIFRGQTPCVARLVTSDVVVVRPAHHFQPVKESCSCCRIGGSGSDSERDGGTVRHTHIDRAGPSRAGAVTPARALGGAWSAPRR